LVASKKIIHHGLPPSKICPAPKGDGCGDVDHATPRRKIENAKRAHGGKTFGARKAYASTIVHQNQLSANGLCKCNRRAFTIAKLRQR
jgi:hypothetical protein